MIPALFPVSAGITSPLSITGCVAWYDAADSTTITESSGAISQWNDKTSAAYNLTQATAGKKPSYQSAVQNGKNIVRFDGGDVLVSANIGITGNTTGWTVFTVSRPTALTVDQYVFDLKYVSNSFDAIYSGYINSTTGYSSAGGRRAATDSAQAQTDTTARSTSLFQIASAVATYGSTLTLYLNGTQTAQKATFLTSGNAEISSRTLFIGGGASGTPSAPFTGDVAEVIVYAPALSLANHAQVVAYLKRKWGL